MISGSRSCMAAAMAAPFAFASFSSGVAENGVTLNLLSTYKTGQFDSGAAQVVAYDAGSKRVFVANTAANEIDILDLSDPAQPKKLKSVSLAAHGKQVNSVAARNGIVAAAVEAADPQAPGEAVFLDIDGQILGSAPVGAMPDMITFTPAADRVLTANEGEPNGAYDNDPPGGVSIVDISGGFANLSAAMVRTATFEGFDADGLPAGARIGKPGQPLSVDLEPEYIAVSGDGRTAYVTVQEHNVLAIVDVASAEVTDLVGLGFKDWSTLKMDASDKDGGISMKSWPVKGVYQPDGIDAFSVGGQTYLITANEGDAREYDSFVDETRVADVTLDPQAFPNAADLQLPETLGRLKITTVMGDKDGDGDYDELYAYGARSISIWNADGKQVWDSGDEFERKFAELEPAEFNATNDENGSFDNRSDDKGVEPESVVVGEVAGRLYAFVALERQSGIIVYDVTNPLAPSYVTYAGNRDFSGVPEEGTAGDLAPEGLAFVAASDSSNGKPLLIVGNEVSGSVSVYGIE